MSTCSVRANRPEAETDEGTLLLRWPATAAETDDELSSATESLKPLSRVVSTLMPVLENILTLAAAAAAAVAPAFVVATLASVSVSLGAAACASSGRISGDENEELMAERPLLA